MHLNEDFQNLSYNLHKNFDFFFYYKLHNSLPFFSVRLHLKAVLGIVISIMYIDFFWLKTRIKIRKDILQQGPIRREGQSPPFLRNI